MQATISHRDMRNLPPPWRRHHDWVGKKSPPDASRQLRRGLQPYALCFLAVVAMVTHVAAPCGTLHWPHTLHELFTRQGGKRGSCLSDPSGDSCGSGTDGSLERWMLQEWLCETSCVCPEREGKGWGETGVIQQLPFGCIRP